MGFRGGTMRKPAGKVQELSIMGAVGALAFWGATWAQKTYGVPAEPVAALAVGLLAVLASKARDVWSRV